MQRRLFLKQMASVIGVSLLAPNNIFAGNKLNELITWHKILEYGRYSPSPHNLQPWKIKLISQTEAELYYDPARLISISDKGNKFLTIAMGVFIETCATAAARLDLTLEFIDYTVTPSLLNKGPQLFGKMVLQNKKSESMFDPELILKRKTSRLNYQPYPVDEKIIAGLNSISQSFNHSFYASSEKDFVVKTLKLNRDTLFEDLNNEPIRDELKKWLRYSKEEAEKTKDGLWSHCMNFPSKFMKSFFKNPSFYSHGLVKKVVNKYYLHSMDGTKTVGWICGSIKTYPDCINTGRLLAQLWLQLTKNNLFMHPFGSVITNAGAFSKFTELSSAGEDCWFVFRMGYSNEPPKSYRLSVAEILI